MAEKPIDFAAYTRKIRRPRPGDDKNVIRQYLRALPIDQRAEFIAETFRIIAAEFAAMVLEHVRRPPGKRVVRLKKRRPKRARS